MPEFTIKEVRLPELHLPEIKRDEIVRALSGIRVPEVERAIAEPGRRMRNLDLRGLSWRQRALSGADAGKLIAAAVAAGRIARPAPKRARWFPFRKSRWAAVSRSRDRVVAVVRPGPRPSRRGLTVVVALAVAGVATWLLFRNVAIRARLDRARADASRRIDDWRSRDTTDLDLDTGEPVSVTSAETAPAGSETVAEIAEGAANPA